jgi:hypothetical protein
VEGVEGGEIVNFDVDCCHLRASEGREGIADERRLWKV